MSNESKTYAYNLTDGDIVIRNGQTRCVASVVASEDGSGVWVYYTNGDDAFFLAYQTVTIV